jgi:hypothetical protein
VAMTHGRKTARIHEVPLGIYETGLIELVDMDEQVDVNEYGTSATVTLPHAACSGEFLSFEFTSSVVPFFLPLDAFGGGGGGVNDWVGKLLIFDEDPLTTAGDAALAAAGAEHKTLVGIVDIPASAWVLDSAGGGAFVGDCLVPFHELTTAYFVWFHLDAESINSDALDDEELHVNAWIRLDT